MSERNHQEKRVSSSIPRECVEPSIGTECDLVIEINLHAALAGPGLGYDPHLSRRISRAARPVGGPAKIRGVNIGCQSLLESMSLVRANEMHLPREAGTVA